MIHSNLALSPLALCGVALWLGCASPPLQPLAAPVLTAESGEQQNLDHLVVLVDASASVPEGGLYRDQKALLESVARSIPDGDYQTAIINFGGYSRESVSLTDFSREQFSADTAALSHLDEGTPIHRALSEAAAQLAGHGGRAAVLLITDGELTDEVGRNLDPERAVEAATALGEGYEGQVCLHAVQSGDNEAGAALLERLSQAGNCGSFRSAQAIDSVASLHQFERDLFFAELPVAGATPSDLDRDGVVDSRDNCPGTPLGAHVDDRGCWTVREVSFRTDSAQVRPEGAAALDEVAEVLRENPELRVRIEGHTDNRGGDRYNELLSWRRAKAARDYLVERGISAERLEPHGFGEKRPAATNKSESGWKQNRRTELTVLR